MARPELLEQCYRSSAELLARWGWRLLSAEDLARRAEVSLSQEGDAAGESVVERAAFREYGREMYRVCGDDGGAAQRLAFNELWAYLYPIARRKTGDADLAREATQRALAQVWRKLEQCCDPASFFNWATMIVINEVRQEFRKQTTAVANNGEEKGKGSRRQPREVPLADLRADGETGDTSWLEKRMANGGTGPVMAVVRRESDERLVTALQETLRSEMQRRVIIGLFIEEKGTLELAEELGITPTNIYTLKSRALARLRDDATFLETLADLLEEG